MTSIDKATADKLARLVSLVEYQTTPIVVAEGGYSTPQGDSVGNQYASLITKLDKTNDAVTAYINGADSRVAITASAQVLSGPGKLKGFWIISHTAGATVRFSDALTATTPYVSSAFTTVSGNLAGSYIMIAQHGIKMVTGCYCTITGTIEILPDAILD